MHVLAQVASMTLGQLRLLLDPALDSATQGSELKAVLRVVRTELKQFHEQLNAKCGAFIEALINGALPLNICSASTCLTWNT